MYNFLDFKLNPKVSTSAAAMEGYEASNLISNNSLTKSRGFLAFPSMKPPVDIIFELMCSIDVHYISICTSLGSQKTTGIEILDENQESLGKSFFNENGIVFYNSKYYSHKSNNKIEPLYHQAYLKFHLRKIYSHINKIRIRILKTERSVPCIGPVVIFGNPSKKCPKEILETVQNILTNPTSNISIKNNEENIENNVQSFQIPEEFKDALTFEVMALPMTLPSGYSIDQSSLEKCIAQDMSSGRKPSDPFTGIEFTSRCKAVFNSALKNRIDLFLISNSHHRETFNISRTIGRTSVKRSNDFELYKESPCKRINSSEMSSVSSISSSLDEEIAKVVGSGNFVCFTKDATAMAINNCFCCKSDENLYEIISCKHLYCRNCLLKLENVCKSCGSSFSNVNVRKFHV